MESKHTPAPWIADAQGEIKTPGGKYIACCGDPSFIPRTDDIENSRLIASAPALLAACEAAMGRLQNPMLDASLFSDVKEQLRAAIESAKGEA